MKLNKRALLLAMATAQITDGELCEKSKVAISTLSQIKRGRNNPRPVTIGKLAAALNVQPEELLEEV